MQDILLLGNLSYLWRKIQASIVYKKILLTRSISKISRFAQLDLSTEGQLLLHKRDNHKDAQEYYRTKTRTQFLHITSKPEERKFNPGNAVWQLPKVLLKEKRYLSSHRINDHRSARTPAKYPINPALCPSLIVGVPKRLSPSVPLSPQTKPSPDAAVSEKEMPCNFYKRCMHARCM